MNRRQQTLQQIRSLAVREGLTAAEIEAALAEPGIADIEPQRDRFARVASYLGGVLILGGIFAYFGMYWDSLGSFGRVLVTLGTGFALYVALLVTSAQGRTARLEAPLVLASAALETTGLFIFLHEYFPPTDDPRYAVLGVCLAMFVQQALTWTARRHVSALIFTASGFASAAYIVTLDLFDVDGNIVLLGLAVSYLLFGHALSRTIHASLSGFYYFFGTIFLSYQIFDLVERTAVEFIFPLLCCLLVYLSTSLRSRSMLVVSTLGLLSYIGYFTVEHFTQTLGWPLALILTGTLFMMLGAWAVRIDRRYIRAKA